MTGAELKETERVLKALANHRRILLLQWLHADPPISVGDMAEKLRLSFKSTSKHLSVLKSAHIVEAEQINTVMNYRLAQPLHPLVKLLLK